MKISKYIFVCVLVVILAAIFSIPFGCDKQQEGDNSNLEPSKDEVPPIYLFDYAGLTVVTMVFRRQLDSKEFTVKFALFEEDAPETCENFKTLVLAGHYDGSLIHRLVKENIYIIQGGGYKLVPKDDGSNNMILKKLDSIAPITNEYNDNNEWVTKGGNNTIQHEAGVIAMARTDNPAITTDQFYFNFNDNLEFNNRYAAFGKCIDKVSLLNLVELGKSETETIAAGFADFPIPIIEVVAVTIDE